MKLNERRPANKTRLLEGKGCCVCGRKEPLCGLCFHHRDRATKKFNISGTNLTKRSWADLQAEAQKCDVLCLICHGELTRLENLSI